MKLTRPYTFSLRSSLSARVGQAYMSNINEVARQRQVGVGEDGGDEGRERALTSS